MFELPGSTYMWIVFNINTIALYNVLLVESEDTKTQILRSTRGLKHPRIWHRQGLGSRPPRYCMMTVYTVDK